MLRMVCNIFFLNFYLWFILGDTTANSTDDDENTMEE